MTNYEIREKARRDLGGKLFGAKWMNALAAALIYSLLLGAISAIPYVGQVASLLLAGPLLFGITGYFLKLSRNTEPATIEGLFDGFNDFTELFLLNLIMGLYIFLWSLLFIIPGIIKTYAYSMAFYIKRDNPTYGWKQCLDESQRLMDGHKGELFCLHLSFIGWALLCVLTLGIGTLWLQPYMMASEANFYASIAGEPIAQSEPASEEPMNTNTFENLR